VRLAHPIETKQWSWLRGVDLNHRPLGYEPKHSMMRNDLQHNLGAWMAAKRV